MSYREIEQHSGDMAQASDAIDLAFLRDLLVLLRDSHVSRFSAAGISVMFKNDPERNYEHFSSSAHEEASLNFRAVTGPKDGWKNPLLWPGQGGKILKFDGTLE